MSGESSCSFVIRVDVRSRGSRDFLNVLDLKVDGLSGVVLDRLQPKTTGVGWPEGPRDTNGFHRGESVSPSFGQFPPWRAGGFEFGFETGQGFRRTRDWSGAPKVCVSRRSTRPTGEGALRVGRDNRVRGRGGVSQDVSHEVLRGVGRSGGPWTDTRSYGTQGKRSDRRRPDLTQKDFRNTRSSIGEHRRKLIVTPSTRLYVQSDLSQDPLLVLSVGLVGEMTRRSGYRGKPRRPVFPRKDERIGMTPECRGFRGCGWSRVGRSRTP